MIRVGEERAAVYLKRLPVISPAALQGLKVDELRAVPLEDTRGAWVSGFDVIEVALIVPATV